MLKNQRKDTYYPAFAEVWGVLRRRSDRLTLKLSLQHSKNLVV